MMATCKCQGLQATGKIQNSNALYRPKGSNFVSSRELLDILSGADKSCYTLVNYHQWKLLSLIRTQFILALTQGRRLLCCVHCDTCGFYQPKDCST